MKWFFTILILIIAIFFYIFAVDKQTEKDTVDLETIDDNIEYIKPVSIDTVLPILDEDTPKSIPQEQTFDTIKNIIESIKGRKITLTLNSRIQSYIYTDVEKSRFKSELAKYFDLDLDLIEKNYDKNQLVWDWVNQLRD